jgi:hypothetical protein
MGGGIDSSLRAAAARADVRQHELAAARHALAANLAIAAITRARLAAQIESLSAILRTSTLVDLAQVRTRWAMRPPTK